MKGLRGICPAIVTPLHRKGQFDAAAMRRIVQYQLRCGVDGFYVCGGTGEGLLLTATERQAVLKTVLDETAGQAAVIAHIGAFQTADTLKLARHASDAAADAIAAMPPAYLESCSLLWSLCVVDIRPRIPKTWPRTPELAQSMMNWIPGLYRNM